MLGILILVGICIVVAITSRAITANRKAVNANVRQSLRVTSDKSEDELARIVALGLTQAGLTNAGHFDNTQYFRLNSCIQMEVKVQPDGGRSQATISLPSVRSSEGRPQALRPVGKALDVAASSIRQSDPGALIQ
jgi:hypothetical protein